MTLDEPESVVEELRYHYLAYEEYETPDEEMYSAPKGIAVEVLEAIWVGWRGIQLGKMAFVDLERKGEWGLLSG